MIRKILIVLLLSVMLIGCSGGKMYRVDYDDGTYMKAKNIGHSGFWREGAEFTQFSYCDPNAVQVPGPPLLDAEGCKVVGQVTSTNSPAGKYVVGAGAVVGSAALIGDGISKSGGQTNVNNDSSSNSAAMGYSSNKIQVDTRKGYAPTNY
jgi:hypothetical protein